MSFHTNPRLLATVPTLVFVGLSLAIAVVPGFQVNERYKPIEGAAAAVAPEEAKAVEEGRAIYIAEGCSYCHTQQVRSDLRLPPEEDGRPRPLAVDARYGRASRPEDYVSDAPPLLGSERVGPDLADVGARMPSKEWHYLHLFNPRAVSPSSVMPPFPWYFRGKDDHGPDDVRVPLTDGERARLAKDERKRRDVELWATPKAQHLVRYLLSRKQAP